MTQYLKVSELEQIMDQIGFLQERCSKLTHDAKSPTWNSCPITPTRSYTYQRFQWVVSYAGDNIRVTSEFVKWRGRANVINVGLSLLCVYDEKGSREIPR